MTTIPTPTGSVPRRVVAAIAAAALIAAGSVAITSVSSPGQVLALPGAAESTVVTVELLAQVGLDQPTIHHDELPDRLRITSNVAHEPGRLGRTRHGGAMQRQQKSDESHRTKPGTAVRWRNLPLVDEHHSITGALWRPDQAHR